MIGKRWEIYKLDSIKKEQSLIPLRSHKKSPDCYYEGINCFSFRKNVS